jgi:hypothetical protein
MEVKYVMNESLKLTAIQHKKNKIVESTQFIDPFGTTCGPQFINTALVYMTEIMYETYLERKGLAMDPRPKDVFPPLFQPTTLNQMANCFITIEVSSGHVTQMVVTALFGLRIFCRVFGRSRNPIHPHGGFVTNWGC